MSEEDQLVLHKLREELDRSENIAYRAMLYSADVGDTNKRLVGEKILLETRLRESADETPLPFLGILILCAISMAFGVVIGWWLL